MLAKLAIRAFFGALGLWISWKILGGGIEFSNMTALVIAACVLGVVNAIVRPVVMLLTLPLTIITLGLFLLVLNALLFYAVGSILKGFQVDSFWWAFIGALLYSLFSWAFSSLLKSR